LVLVTLLFVILTLVPTLTPLYSSAKVATYLKLSTPQSTNVDVVVELNSAKMNTKIVLVEEVVELPPNKITP